jgi:hypothetical protein
MGLAPRNHSTVASRIRIQSPQYSRRGGSCVRKSQIAGVSHVSSLLTHRGKEACRWNLRLDVIRGCLKKR